jgi:selenium metabolism protein YedF
MADKVIVIASDKLGQGDDRLGEMLMASFLRTLGENEEKPAELIFVNAGVRLVCEGSRVLDHVEKLARQGVAVQACTTCLEYYDLMDTLLLGAPTTMAKTVKSVMTGEAVSL